MLKSTQSHLEYVRTKRTLYTCDLTTIGTTLKKTATILPSLRNHRLYAPDLPESHLLHCADAILDCAIEISNQRWVKKWKEAVVRYLGKFCHLAGYAHRRFSEELGNKALSVPTLLACAPMPFGAQLASYDERSDKLVFLTTGVGGRTELYIPKRDRKNSPRELYEGYTWPMSYVKMTYLVAHETAHRCLHLSVPKNVDSYLHRTGTFPVLEEKICEVLGLELLLSRARSDRKLRRSRIYSLLGRALFSE